VQSTEGSNGCVWAFTTFLVVIDGNQYDVIDITLSHVFQDLVRRYINLLSSLNFDKFFTQRTKMVLEGNMQV
jgi:hypothetical protein